MEIQKGDDQKKQLRTLVLSTDANDYDTGEPIIDGSISKTLVSNNNQIADNPILASLHGVVVGRKYCARYESRKEELQPKSAMSIQIAWTMNGTMILKGPSRGILLKAVMMVLRTKENPKLTLFIILNLWI